MDFIIPLKGKVQYPLTLDPSVWIFDDRKIDLEEGLDSIGNDADSEINDTEVLSRNWQKEIMEGAVSPPTLKTEKKFQKERILNGTFVMPIKPFLTTAEPLEDAMNLKIKTKNENITVSLDEGFELFLLFSRKGKPLKDDGPIHVIYGDGSNLNTPITDVLAFIIE